MNLKRIIGFLVVIFVLFFVITQPETSANIVQTVFNWLSSAASGIAEFLTTLF